MANVFNTSYKVQSDVNTESERLNYAIEEGAYVTTPSGVWTVYQGQWARIFPQYPTQQSLGWARYDDGQYTSANKLSLADGVEVVLPNNASSIVRSNVGFDYYNPTTQKITADNENDTYVMTVVFKYSAANANQTYLEVHFQGGNGTPYDRIRDTITCPRGNDVPHDYHGMFQYYADANFITNGSQWRITSVGGTAEIWDVIFFVQKTQSYA